MIPAASYQRSAVARLALVHGIEEAIARAERCPVDDWDNGWPRRLEAARKLAADLRASEERYRVHENKAREAEKDKP